VLRQAIRGLVLLVSFGGAVSAAAADAPPGASSCSGCHPASAAVQTPVPRLVVRPAVEIVAAMQAFRAGQRPATVMDRIAKGFSEPEIAAIAAWYAAQNAELRQR
jgi:sulfide dehydrogenase cytochrome subunit